MLGLDPFILRQLSAAERWLWRGAQTLALLNVLVGGFAAGAFAVLVFARWEAAGVGILWGLVFLNLQRFVFAIQDEAPLRFGTFLTLIIKTTIMCFFALLVAGPLATFLLAAPKESQAENQRERIDALHEVHEARRAAAVSEIEAEVRRVEDERANRQGTVETLRDGMDGADKGLRLMQRQLRAAERDLLSYELQAEVQLTALRERERAAVDADERERALIETQFRDQVFVLDRVRGVYAQRSSDCRWLWALLCVAYCLPFWLRRVFRARLGYFRVRSALDAELRERVRGDFADRYLQIVRESWKQPSYRLPRS